MSNSIRYISLEPVNLKTTYSEYDTIEFDVIFSGRKLRLNNIRLAADIATPNGTPTTGDLRTKNTLNDFQLDPMVGAHSFIDSISTEFSNAGKNSGTVESLQEYPRYAKMYYAGTQTMDGQMGSACAPELRCPSMKCSNVLLRGGQAGKAAGQVYIPTNPHLTQSPRLRANRCLVSVR